MLGSGALWCSGSGPVEPRSKLSTQFMRLRGDGVSFTILVGANADLYNLPVGLSRAVILFGPAPDGESFLADETLLMAPVFLEPGDPRVRSDMPAWQTDDWARGARSGYARRGVRALSVVDGLLRYLADHPALADLQVVDLVGQGAGAELLRRHAARSAGGPGRLRLRYRLQQASE